jgi:hypothetical protein
MGDLSLSGLITLVCLLVCGPLVLGAKDLYLKVTGKRKEREASGSEEATPTTLSVNAAGQLEEQVTGQHERHSFGSTEYVFALIGYAIGLANVWYVLLSTAPTPTFQLILSCHNAFDTSKFRISQIA